MQGRTFFRTMFEKLFVDNVICRTVNSFVKFCNEQYYFSNKELKFSEFVPLDKNVTENDYKNKFIFNSSIRSEAIIK
ncbi:MAG: hypothetical protein MJ237_02480 [bacterium]|nr:hypothetical protein [bacterium]